MVVMSASRGRPCPTCGQNAANAIASPLSVDAQPDTDVNHIIHPTWKPAQRPNAARAYTMGPPVLSNRLPTSAKHRLTTMQATPTPPNMNGPHAPTFAATVPGKR